MSQKYFNLICFQMKNVVKLFSFSSMMGNVVRTHRLHVITSLSVNSATADVKI